jgi:hypothetical protein
VSAGVSLGAFFEVHQHDRSSVPAPPWRPLAELVTTSDVLGNRVERVREALAGAAARPPAALERRIAASVTHLGLMARVISPALAQAAESGVVGYLDLDELWWQDELGGAFPLSVPKSPPQSGQLRQLVDGPIAGLTTVIGDRFGVARSVLWGNVASAINGAATMFGRARPDQGEAARTVAARLMAHPALAGEDGRPGDGFRRRSCCLIYRLSSAGRAAVCGDCVLVQ